MQYFAEDELVPLACSHNLPSLYVISVAPAFGVIDMTLESSLVESDVPIAEHHSRLQNPGSFYLRDIAITNCFWGQNLWVVSPQSHRWYYL